MIHGTLIVHFMWVLYGNNLLTGILDMNKMIGRIQLKNKDNSIQIHFMVQFDMQFRSEYDENSLEWYKK